MNTKSKREVNSLSLEEISSENKKLKAENKFLRDQLNSRRFRFANRIATSFNKFFPQHSPQRKLIVVAGKSAKKAEKAISSIPDKLRIKTMKKNMENYDRVIVLNSIPWTVKLKQRPQHMAEQLSRLGYFVIYLERWESKRYRKFSNTLITVNNEKFLEEVPAKCKKYFFTSSTTTDMEVVKYARNLKYKIIYEYIDEIHGDISDNTHLLIDSFENLEKMKPFLLLASAKNLYKQLEKRFNKSKLLLSQNAVNAEHFNYEKIRPEKPSAMAKIVAKKKPIVGFYGAVAPWLDYNLLNGLAKRRNDLSFVYIGVDYGKGLEKLKMYENVYFLGPKNYDELPKYSYWFDCAIIPFSRGPIAESTSPVKLFEYIAMGLPTVCTKDLAECAGYDYVYMSDADKKFEENIDKAIKDKKDPAKRKVLLNYALENTWKQRAMDLDDAIKRLEKK